MLAPEQARDLVDHFGSKAAAARAIGVSHPTITYWLEPDWAEDKRARVRARYDGLSGYEYSRLLLLRRRTKALWRLDQRRGPDGALSPQE